MDNSSNPVLTNVTFSGNTATFASGMYSEHFSGPVVRNSILWGDSAGEIAIDANSAITVTGSIVQGGYPGEGNLDADPLLAPLGDYGGETQTVALLPGSPAIDAANANCPETDQRGLPRSLPHCDLGAFESQGFSLAIAGGDRQAAPINTAFARPLEVTVTAVLAGEPVDGGQVTFRAPASGASASITGSPATLSTGTASVEAAANALAGAYPVTACAAGAGGYAGCVDFHLLNATDRVYLPVMSQPNR
jgi:hypothetical protein